MKKNPGPPIARIGGCGGLTTSLLRLIKPEIPNRSYFAATGRTHCITIRLGAEIGIKSPKPFL
jgi:hypothetical protein